MFKLKSTSMVVKFGQDLPYNNVFFLPNNLNNTSGTICLSAMWQKRKKYEAYTIYLLHVPLKTDNRKQYERNDLHFFHSIEPIFTPSVSFFSSNFDADWSTNSLCIVGNDKAFITEWTFLMCDDLIIHVSHLGYCLVIIWQIYSDILSLHSESDGEGLKRLTKFEWTEHYSKTFLVINSCSLFFLVWIRNLFFYEREEWNNFPFHDYVPIIITKIDNDNILILPFWPHIMLCLITFGSASCPCFR